MSRDEFVRVSSFWGVGRFSICCCGNGSYFLRLKRELQRLELQSRSTIGAIDRVRQMAIIVLKNYCTASVKQVSHHGEGEGNNISETSFPKDGFTNDSVK
jgi:hypothetical protein